MSDALNESTKIVNFFSFYYLFLFISLFFSLEGKGKYKIINMSALVV